MFTLAILASGQPTRSRLEKETLEEHMSLQDEFWAGLFLRNARALAISIIAILSFVSRASAALATPLKAVHDTFHQALRDGDAAPLDQLLDPQFVWTDCGHMWNKSDLLAQLRGGKLRYLDFQADLESHAEYGLAAVVSGRSRYRTATAVKPSEFRYTLTLVKIGRAWRVAAYHISIMPNSAQPLQVRLGYPANAKLVILNADDLAVSHSEDVASFAALDNKFISSATVMVPCPWFSEVAAYAKAHPAVDLGLHLTFTSEWQSYRWGPVSMRALVPSLVGPDGYFYPNAQEFAKHARLDEVELEIRAQIERALAMGLQPSHLDAHMHSLYVTPDLFRIMLKVAHEYKLPVRMASNIDLFRPGLAVMPPGDPLVDAIFSPGEEVPASGWKDYYITLLKNLQPGVTEIIVHLAHDDAESQAIMVGHLEWGAAWRQREFDTISSPEFRHALEENHVVIIGWRDIQRLM
jgi:predicted glycoside hydrolase/deacetylase ChbG (UPF0249 family)